MQEGGNKTDNELSKFKHIPSARKTTNVMNFKRSILGRPWKKDSPTEWKTFGRVRYSRDCKGSYACINPKCEFKKEFGVVICTQFNNKSKSCEVSGSKGKHVPCLTRRYVVRKKQSVFVYHFSYHTYPWKPVIFKPVEDVRWTVSENPTLTPSQIQSNIILSMMKQRTDWASIEKAAIETQKMDLK